MSAPVPQPELVGASFAQQYYKLLASDRSKLPGLYHTDGKVKHTIGTEDGEQHVGLFAITNFFNSLNYTDVTLDLEAGALDTQAVGSDILVLLTGLIGFNGNPANMRFSHSIVLGAQAGPEGVIYAVQGDIFRAYAPPPTPAAAVPVQFGVVGAPAPQPPVVPEATWPVEQEEPAAPAPAPVPAPVPAPAPVQPAEEEEAAPQEAEEEVVEEEVSAAAADALQPAAEADLAAAPDATPAPVGNKSWANVAGGSNPAPAPAPAPKSRPSRKRSPNKRTAAAPKPAPSTAAAAAAAGGDASSAPPAARGRRERTGGRKARVAAEGSVKLSGDFSLVSAEAIKAVLGKFGAITGVSANTMSKGFVFVDFEKKDSVAKAAAAGTVVIGAITASVVENKNFDSKRQGRSGGRGGRRAGGRSGGRGAQGAAPAPAQ